MSLSERNLSRIDWIDERRVVGDCKFIKNGYNQTQKLILTQSIQSKAKVYLYRRVLRLHNIQSAVMLRLLKQGSKSFSTTIFDKILNKTIPSQAVYEDQHIYAFKDIKPQAPVHILIIPKIKDGLSGISQAQQKNKQILGHMLVSVPTIAAKVGLTNGYRLVINEGPEGCQQVLHLHIHLLGGRQMRWPPG